MYYITRDFLDGSSYVFIVRIDGKCPAPCLPHNEGYLAISFYLCACKSKNEESPNMAGLKSLMKDTMIYGMSSIVGRFLNYLLVPLYTAKLAVESGGYGVVTEIYSYVALLLVLLTFGMETAFFRFINK